MTDGQHNHFQTLDGTLKEENSLALPYKSYSDLNMVLEVWNTEPQFNAEVLAFDIMTYKKNVRSRVTRRRTYGSWQMTVAIVLTAGSE